MTARSAPERIVYEVFAAEVAENSRRSTDPALTPEHRQRIGTRLQLITGLTGADYAALKDISVGLVSALGANAKEGDLVSKDMRLTISQRSAAIAVLREKRDAAVDAAIQQWKQRIGIRFRWVDDKIRAHVAPGLRVSDAPPAAPAEQGGPSK